MNERNQRRGSGSASDRQTGATVFWRLETAARIVRLPSAAVRGYVEAGVVRPARVEGEVRLFGEDELARLRKIRRLRRDLGINGAGIEVVMHLLDEIELLRAQDRRRTHAGVRRET